MRTAEALVYQRQCVSLPRISCRRRSGTYIGALRYYCVIGYPYQEKRDRKERRGEERRLDYQAKTSGRIYRAIWPRQVNLNRKEVTPERTRWKNEKPS
jgi:hypothetical protein